MPPSKAPLESGVPQKLTPTSDHRTTYPGLKKTATLAGLH